MPLPEHTYALSLTDEQVMSLGAAFQCEDEEKSIRAVALYILLGLRDKNLIVSDYEVSQLAYDAMKRAIVVHKTTREQIVKLLEALHDDTADD